MSNTAVTPVSARFSAAATTYDDSAQIQRLVADRLVTGFLANIAAQPARILEIGCGTGICTGMLAHRFPRARIEAVDIAAPLVEIARRRFAANAAVRCRVANALSMASAETFPLIISSSALHWMTPLDTLFRNLARLLAPGGRLVFAMMLRGTLKELHEARSRALPDKPVPERLADELEVLETLSRCRFTVCRHEHETLTAHYASADDLFTAIHRMGVTGGPVSSAGTPLSRGELARLARDYDEHYADRQSGVYASYKVLYAEAAHQPDAAANEEP